MSINDLFKIIEANTSRNFKIEKLAQYKGNETLKRVVRLALDPFIQFYIRKIPKYTCDNPKPMLLSKALDMLSDLSSRKVTGNAGIDRLTYILSNVSCDDAQIIERVIEKDLRCGASIATVNTVWDNLIPEYPVMLCSQFDQKLVDKIKFPAYAQMKMDGMRFNAIVRDGKCEFRSRNGKQIQLLGNLEQEFISLAGSVDCVFDGELLVMLKGDHQFADRQTGNGILNKANKGTISAEQAALVHATVWDLIPYVQFVDGYCATPYAERYATLQAIISKQKSEGKKIWNVTSTIVETLEEAQEIFQEYLAEGFEGIILKDGNGVWENKRAKHQIKFKGELECDLKIVAIESGSGKYQGMLGAIVCESMDRVICVSVGSGFNDDQRKTYGNDIVGKIVSVKYNARITNKQGKNSLFLPIFVELREDKIKADLSNDIR